jgi:hypothetical protein
MNGYLAVVADGAQTRFMALEQRHGYACAAGERPACCRAVLRSIVCQPASR